LCALGVIATCARHIRLATAALCIRAIGQNTHNCERITGCAVRSTVVS